MHFPHVMFVLDIQKAVTYKQEILLLFDNNKIQRLELVPVAKLVSKLFHTHNYNLCARVATFFHSTLTGTNCRRYVPVSLITDLKQQIQSENDSELASKLEHLLQNVKAEQEENESTSDSGSQRSKVSFDKLESGIYVLRQRSESEMSASAENDIPTHQEENEGTSTNMQGDNNDLIVEYKREPVEIPTIEFMAPKDDSSEHQTRAVEEDSVSRESSSLSRHQSTECLVSLNGLSSNELVFGPPNIGKLFCLTLNLFH